VSILNFGQNYVGDHRSTALLHFFAGIQYRSHYLVIPSASAEISRQPMADPAFVGAGLLVQKALGGHDETRSADAALEGGIFQERLLYRMKSVGSGQSLDGGYFPALDLYT
jgi:hypothetical protein